MGDFIGQSVMYLLGRHQRDTAMMMLLVIPKEKVLAESPAILNGPKPLRELRAVLERPELGFRVRVVIADMRTTVGFRHPQVR